MIPLKFYIHPPIKEEATLERSTLPLKVLSLGDESVTVEMQMHMSVNQHLEELQKHFRGHTLSIEMPQRAKTITITPNKLRIDSSDLLNVKGTGVLIWDSLFAKPNPVFDSTHWAESEESSKFIYNPNCTRYGGNISEDHNSNAMYTMVMLHAYKAMCLKEGINPTIQLKNGRTFPAVKLSLHMSVQADKIGERVSGLADSFLVDFDDSKYVKPFLHAVVNLPPDQYATEPSRRTVLAKSELILAGETSHLYNQRFVQRFYTLLSVNYKEEFSTLFKEHSSEAEVQVLNILRAMIIDGFVLEASLEELKGRLWSAQMSKAVDLFEEIYGVCTDA